MEKTLQIRCVKNTVWKPAFETRRRKPHLKHRSRVFCPMFTLLPSRPLSYPCPVQKSSLEKGCPSPPLEISASEKAEREREGVPLFSVLGRMETVGMTAVTIQITNRVPRERAPCRAPRIVAFEAWLNYRNCGPPLAFPQRSRSTCVVKQKGIL